MKFKPGDTIRRVKGGTHGTVSVGDTVTVHSYDPDKNCGLKIVEALNWNYDSSNFVFADPVSEPKQPTYSIYH